MVRPERKRRKGEKAKQRKKRLFPRPPLFPLSFLPTWWLDKKEKKRKARERGNEGNVCFSRPRLFLSPHIPLFFSLVPTWWLGKKEKRKKEKGERERRNERNNAPAFFYSSGVARVREFREAPPASENAGWATPMSSCTGRELTRESAVRGLATSHIKKDIYVCVYKSKGPRYAQPIVATRLLESVHTPVPTRSFASDFTTATTRGGKQMHALWCSPGGYDYSVSARGHQKRKKSPLSRTDPGLDSLSHSDHSHGSVAAVPGPAAA